MDPSYADSDEEADAMAAAMGFSSFGTQGPPKKRRFNPNTDALVDDQELQALDRGGKKGQGSGGNTIPLGKQRIIGQKAIVNNEDEIDMGEGEEEAEPAYMDTSQQAPLEEQEAMQQKIDAILAGLDQDAEDGEDAFLSRDIEPTYPQAQHQLPQRPIHAPTGYATKDQKSRVWGQRNELWYVGYFDPNFVQNPWAKLEREKGLQARGDWPETIVPPVAKAPKIIQPTFT